MCSTRDAIDKEKAGRAVEVYRYKGREGGNRKRCRECCLVHSGNLRPLLVPIEINRPQGRLALFLIAIDQDSFAAIRATAVVLLLIPGDRRGRTAWRRFRGRKGGETMDGQSGRQR